MDSLVDVDILNLGKKGIDAASSLLAECTPISHETEADLESYRIELKELQNEVNAIQAHNQRIKNDIDLCNQFVERATLFTAAIAPVSAAPKTGSKWGVLKSSIQARPEDAFTVLPPNTVHLPVQPEFAKFFYLATKLEMARRTSKFLGIRAKGPRTEYLEKCAEMRSVIVDAAQERIQQLSEDIAIVQKVNADALNSTLSILEPPPLDRPFSSYFEVPIASAHRSRSPVPAPPTPPMPPQPTTSTSRHASVTFAPFASAPPPPPDHSESASATPRRRSILHDFRSRSYAASAGLVDQASPTGDPALMQFTTQMNALMQALPTVEQVTSSCTQQNNNKTLHDNAMEADDCSMYRIALQAHCAETLDGFHAEMEQKMQDCLTQCNKALARRNGPLSVMKKDPVFAVHIAEVLNRVDDVQEQLHSYIRHQQIIRENTEGEHADMVQQASVTVVHQRLAFLSIIKEKLSSLHARNQQQLKESRKLALIGNAARYQQEAVNNMY